MIFNFNEAAILNTLLIYDNKEDTRRYLQSLLLTTEDEIIKQDLNSVDDKIEKLSEETFEKLYKDRNNHKLTLSPIYMLWVSYFVEIFF